MSRYCDREIDDVLAAAEHWRENALLRVNSVFSSEPIWTSTNVEELDRRFTQSPDETDRGFIEKLHDQLASSIVPVKQLAAEIIWLLLLCPSNISPERKRENIRSVWGWSDLPFPSESQWLTDKALHGIGSGGQAFGHHRPREFTFCIEFLKSFRALSDEGQQALVKRPWEFADWLQHVPGAATRQFRHMLLYILFPDAFERIFSSVDRRSVVERFCNLSKSSVSRLSPLELDRKLEQTRKEAQDKYGTEKLDFYRSPLKEQWQFDLAELASTIKPEHVIQAIVDVQATGVPQDARSTTYDLVYEGGRYPPKLVFSLACKHVTGTTVLEKVDVCCRSVHEMKNPYLAMKRMLNAI